MSETTTTAVEPVKVEVQRVEPQAIQKVEKAPLPLLGETFEDLHRQARALAPSTLIPKHLKVIANGKVDDVATLANVTIVLAYGRELGIGPVAALGGIAVVNGKPFAESRTLAAVVRASGLAHYLTCKESTATSCTWETHRKGEPDPVKKTFTWQMAVRAGYDKKETYQQHPEKMLSARALGWLCNDVYPDLCKGLGTEAERMDYEDDLRGPPPAPKSGSELLRQTIVRNNPQLSPPPPTATPDAPEDPAYVAAHEQAAMEPGSNG